MKINLGVVFGGCSVEHEISVVSALQAIYALNKEKYNVIPMYIAKSGDIYTGEKLLDIDEYKNIEKLLNNAVKVVPVKEGTEVYLYRHPDKGFRIKKLSRIDFILPVVHGTNCEDGTLQGFIEMLGLPYAGCDVLSSALGMDKVAMKEVYKANGIPVVDYMSFYSYEWSSKKETIINDIKERIGFPVIVKPANLGSSIGITKANNEEELEDAVDLAEKFALKIIVEKAIRALREINCSVLGDVEEAYASACEEPISSDEILSYSEKYMGESKGKGMASATRKLPAELSPDKEAEIKNYAIKAFKVLGCSGVARVDFLIDKDNNDAVYVNEINTIPGSLSFYLWEAVGKSFEQLLEELIQLGFKRHRDRENLMITYDAEYFSMGSFKGLRG